jgi:hypothetical protein
MRSLIASSFIAFPKGKNQHVVHWLSFDPVDAESAEYPPAHTPG